MDGLKSELSLQLHLAWFSSISSTVPWFLCTREQIIVDNYLVESKKFTNSKFSCSRLSEDMVHT